MNGETIVVDYHALANDNPLPTVYDPPMGKSLPISTCILSQRTGDRESRH